MLRSLGGQEIVLLSFICCLCAAILAWAVWVTASIVRLNRKAGGKGP